MTSSLVFENNYALNPDVVGMPTKDITVEFWARTPAYNKSSRPADKKFEDLLNYATHLPGAQGRRIPFSLSYSNLRPSMLGFLAAIMQHNKAAIARLH